MSLSSLKWCILHIHYFFFWKLATWMHSFKARGLLQRLPLKMKKRHLCEGEAVFPSRLPAKGTVICHPTAVSPNRPQHCQPWSRQMSSYHCLPFLCFPWSHQKSYFIRWDCPIMSSLTLSRKLYSQKPENQFSISKHKVFTKKHANRKSIHLPFLMVLLILRDESLLALQALISLLQPAHYYAAHMYSVTNT